MKIKKAQIAPLLQASFPEYSGRKFSVEFAEEVTLYNLNWDGGSRNEYAAISMEDGKIGALPQRAPWDNQYEGQTITMNPNVVIACHTFYCGQDMGVKFYAHPSRQQQMLEG